MFTEYQTMLYKELGMTIKRHFIENDVTAVEVIGIMDIIMNEIREETILSQFCSNTWPDDSESSL